MRQPACLTLALLCFLGLCRLLLCASSELAAADDESMDSIEIAGSYKGILTEPSDASLGSGADEGTEFFEDDPEVSIEAAALAHWERFVESLKDFDSYGIEFQVIKSTARSRQKSQWEGRLIAKSVHQNEPSPRLRMELYPRGDTEAMPLIYWFFRENPAAVWRADGERALQDPLDSVTVPRFHFTHMDFLMDYVNWDKVYRGVQKSSGRMAYVFDLYSYESKLSAYSRAEIYLDLEFPVLLKVRLYHQMEGLQKELTLSGFKKIRGQYFPKGFKLKYWEGGKRAQVEELVLSDAAYAHYQDSLFELPEEVELR